MPDINIFQEPKPVGQQPVLPQQIQQKPNSNLLTLPLGNTPMWVNTSSAQIPYTTRLDQTLRYTDPKIGYNPFDESLEYKYAAAHPFATFGNNVTKGFAKLAGTFVESFATIPLAIDAVVSKDFSKLYDNDLTNTIQDWYDNLENSLPTYQTQKQAEHPILSWFSSDIFNNIGGAINNLGFTAGAILGTVAEGAVITALTGGTGTLPAIGANITRFFSKFGRAIAAGGETAAEMGNIAKTALQAGEETKLLENVGAHQMGGTWKKLGTTERDLVAVDRIPEEAAATQALATNGNTALATIQEANAETGLIRHTGIGVGNEFAAGVGATRNATVNQINKSLDNLYKITKIGDAAKYHLSLLTSAMSEGAFEANSVMRNTIENSKQAFYDKNGYDPTAKDLDEIKALSHTVGDFTMGANIAILYASNHLNWGSLFRPTKATAEAAIDGGLFRGFQKFGKTFNTEKGVYELLDKTPSSRLGKALLYLASPSRHIQQAIGEGAEEGAQFIISEGATDYAKRKYDGTSRGEFADYIKSFNYGVSRTFQSNEGWENIIGGFVGGIFGGFLEHAGNKMRGVQHMSAKARLEQQIAGLNEETFKNVFSHTIDGAVAQQSMTKDYQDAIQANDLFKAKNIKAEILHNWVNTAVKTNSFDARLDEIEAAKNLKGEEFRKMWGGLDYNEDNRQEAVAYLDKVKEKAKGVKNDIEKIDRLFRGNPFNRKTQQLDYAAHETWKESLARNLGFSRDYQGRITELSSDINRVLPGMNVNAAIQLTSKQGISDILGKMSTAIDNLAKTASETESNPDVSRPFRQKYKELSKLYAEMQQHVFNNFEAKDFIPTLRKMYDLMSGGSFENNKYLDGQKLLKEPGVIHIQSNENKINDDDVVDIFERLQDTNKLHGINYQAVSAYNALLKPSGAKKYSNYVKDAINTTNNGVRLTEDGRVETPVDVERQADEEANLRTSHLAEEDNLTKEQRDTMNDIILKEAAGKDLTPEETEILKEHPLYTEKVKTKEAIKAAIIKEKSPRQQVKETNQAQQQEAEKENYNKDESGYRKEVSPVELLNKLNSHEKVGKDANKNLFKAIFQKVNNFLHTNITAKLASSDFATERGANGNVKQKYTPIDLFDKNGKKTGTSGIYKSRYERNVEIYHNGEMIGLLKPADSLFLDAAGQRSIYEMTEAEFTNVTGMPRTEYKGYMKELNTYKKAYEGLLEDLNKNEGKSTNETVLKYFPEIRVNTGNTIFNRSADKEKDTLIKDLAHRPSGTALISYKNENGYRKATIVNERELASKLPSYYNKLQAFIKSDTFKAQANQTEGRYMLAVPVNGEYQQKSLIFSRPAEINVETKDKLVSLLKDNIGKELTPTQVEDINNELHNNYYIANADRTIKGTSLDLQINEDGSLSFTIKNNEAKTAYNNTINISDANIKDYDSLIKTLQKSIDDTERLDANLQKLQIVLKDDSIKYQTPNDKDVSSLKDVEDKIKVATTPNVFENYSVNFYPKGSAKGEQQQAKPSQPKAPTATQKQSIIDTVKALKPVADKITDIDVSMAQSDPEEFLKFIADQALGYTRDSNDNRVPDGSGGNETSMLDRYGKDIVEGAKTMFPLEEQARQKTTADLEQEAKLAEQNKFEQQIDSEYNQKKLSLHDSFINNLTEAQNKIKDFITKNPNFVGKEVIDVQNDIAKQAGVSTKDVTDYIQTVKNYNTQRAKLKDIANSKKQATVVGSTSEAIFAKNQVETSIILQDLFNLSKEQADATAAVYERNREAWVQNQYQKELAYRTANKGHSSTTYELEQSAHTIKSINAKINDLNDQMELTNDDGRKMIIQQKIDEQQQKLNEGKKTLYGADLLDYINQQSYTRFGFGKKTTEELNYTDLAQDATTKEIKDALTNNKIIELNCN